MRTSVSYPEQTEQTVLGTARSVGLGSACFDELQCDWANWRPLASIAWPSGVHFNRALQLLCTWSREHINRQPPTLELGTKLHPSRPCPHKPRGGLTTRPPWTFLFHFVFPHGPSSEIQASIVIPKKRPRTRRVRRKNMRRQPALNLTCFPTTHRQAHTHKKLHRLGPTV